MLVDLAKFALKNNALTFGKKNLRGTVIETKVILREVELKTYLWWRYTNDTFFIWEHGQKQKKRIIDALNKRHSTKHLQQNGPKNKLIS